MIVMKFGGTSLGTPDRITTALDIIERARQAALNSGEPAVDTLPIVVLSAHAGVTNGLHDAARNALRGKVDVEPLLDRHRELARSLGVDAEVITPLLTEMKDLLRGISLVGECTARSLDCVASYGERCSVRLIAAAGQKRGIPVVAVDAFDIGMITDDRHGSARPLPDIDPEMRTAVQRITGRGEVPLVTGYIGKTRKGDIATLGRNGSDFTATIIGAAVRAKEVQIWTDVDGVMTADPSLVNNAKPLAVLTFEEAAELAYFGARVLHPATLKPAMRENIDVRVLNTFRPDAPGTIVRPLTGHPAPPPDLHSKAGPVKSIAYKEGQIVVNIHSESMFMESGFLGRVFDVCGECGVVVDMVATSEVTVSFTTDSEAGLNEALKRLEQLPGKPLVTVDAGKAKVGVVGEGIRDTVGVLGRVFDVTKREGVKVDMVAVGASRVNVSFLIAESDIRRTVIAMHDEFFA